VSQSPISPGSLFRGSAPGLCWWCDQCLLLPDSGHLSLVVDRNGARKPQFFPSRWLTLVATPWRRDETKLLLLLADGVVTRHHCGPSCRRHPGIRVTPVFARKHMRTLAHKQVGNVRCRRPTSVFVSGGQLRSGLLGQDRPSQTVSTSQSSGTQSNPNPARDPGGALRLLSDSVVSRIVGG
jgi:hypothetical protein